MRAISLGKNFIMRSKYKTMIILLLLLYQTAAFAVLSETTVNSISEMTNLSGIDVAKIASNTGVDGTFRWVDGSTATANNGTIFDSTSGGNGRWFRVYDGAVHAKWFGAKGDGAQGTNDAPAIQNAIDFILSQGGGTLELSPGTYKISSPLTIVGSYLKISAKGATLSPNASFSGSYAIIVGNNDSTQTHFTTINHLKITGFPNGIYFYGAHFYTVDGCEILYSTNYGLRFYNSWHGYIYRSRGYGNAVGAYLEQNANSVIINKCDFSNNSDIQIEIDNGEGITVSDTTMQGGHYGIYHGTGEVHGLMVSGNYFESNTENAIRLGSNHYVYGGSILSNYFNVNYNSGRTIYIGRTTNLKILGNSFNSLANPPLKVESTIYRKVIETDCEFNPLDSNYWKYTYINHLPGKNYEYTGYSNNDEGFRRAYLDQFKVYTGGNNLAGTPYYYVFDKYERDLEFLNSSGVILKSANGTRYRIKVADDGTLSTEVVN